MNSNFSEELMNLCNNLMQQHKVAYTNMIATFPRGVPNYAVDDTLDRFYRSLLPFGTEQELINSPSIDFRPFIGPCTPPFNTAIDQPFYLPNFDYEIPKEEFECDPEIILVMNLRENLTSLNSNLNGFRAKKFGFREMVEMVVPLPTYTQDVTKSKRNRASMEATFEPLNLATNRGTVEKRTRYESDASSNSNESCVFNQDFIRSEDKKKEFIDDSIRVSENNPVKTENHVFDATGNEVHVLKNEDKSTPSKFRVERMRSIQRKKPKYDVTTLDLSYHSNMARNFPGSELRSQEQQIKRSKNTYAARISRMRNKIYEKMLKEQSVKALVDNVSSKRRIACLSVYADSLMKLNGFTDVSLSKMWEDNIRDQISSG